MVYLVFNKGEYIVNESMELVTSNNEVVHFHEGDIINAVRVYPDLLRLGDNKIALYLDTALSNKFISKISSFETVEFDEGVEFRPTDKSPIFESLPVSSDTDCITVKMNVTEIN